jgi:bacteriocin biosynthesis cyclodehydratase domain-containing protein
VPTSIPARPVFKPSTEVLEASDGDIYLLRPDGPDIALRAPDTATRELVAALRAGERPGDLHVLAPLAAAGLLTRAPDPTALTAADRRRYDRQLHYFADALPPDTGREVAQQRLGAATVCILGVGGLGTWAAAALAQTGIGALILVDDDTVDDSNLNRQILFGERDRGRPKVEAAAERLHALNAATRTAAIEARIGSEHDIAAAIAGADAVIATADQPADRIATWVDAACRRAGIPHISAGQFPPKIRIGPFVIPHATAGICCLHHQLRTAQPLFDELMALRAANATPAATLAGPSATIGGLLATEVMHYVTRIAPPATTGRALLMDLATFATEWQELPTAGCPECSQRPGAAARAGGGCEP